MQQDNLTSTVYSNIIKGHFLVEWDEDDSVLVVCGRNIARIAGCGKNVRLSQAGKFCSTFKIHVYHP